MSQFFPKILPEPSTDTAYRTERLARLSGVVKTFNPWFAKTYAQANMTGEPIDVDAVDYLYYEQLLSPPFFDSEADVCLTTAMVLGEFLVRYLGFVWCRSNLLPNSPYQVFNANNRVHICLPSLIARHWHIRGDMNMDFDRILLDILLMDDNHFIEEHPMTALYNSLWEKSDYIRRFGFYPPDEVVDLFKECYEKNEEDVLRLLEFSVFGLKGADDEWQYIIKILENIKNWGN